MTLSLFWRLTLGYAAILLLSIGVSIYAVVQLGELSTTARTAFETDYRTIEQQERLTDAFLSEVRYGGKFLLTQSPSSYDQFSQFKNDFLRYLGELKKTAGVSDSATQLVRIEHLHQSFHDLLEQEARLIKTGQPYAQSRYQQERTKLLDTTLRELARLKDQLEKTVHDKLEGLGSTARAARNIALATTIILLFAGTALSLKISTSVAKPLVQLTSLLANESGPERGLAQPSNIPEIQKLSDAVIRHRQRILRASEISAKDMEQATEDLVSRVTSLKRQLAELKVEIDSGAPPEVRAFFDALFAESDRLVQHCIELNASAAARTEVMKLPREADPTSAATNAWLLRELPAVQASIPNKVWLHAARGANMVNSLLRQLKRQLANRP